MALLKRSLAGTRRVGSPFRRFFFHASASLLLPLLLLFLLLLLLSLRLLLGRLLSSHHQLLHLLSPGLAVVDISRMKYSNVTSALAMARLVAFFSASLFLM